MTPSALHAADLRVARLVDVDHHPAAVADRHLLVDRLIGAERIFEIAADHAIHAQPEPRRLDAELHEALGRHRLIEMTGPLIVGIARRDDLGDRGIGVSAEVDAFHAQDVVAAAAAADRAGVVVEQVDEPFVVEGRARHADRRVHAQGQRIALGVLAVGADHRGRESVSLIERGGAGRRIGLRTETDALQPIGIFEARQVAEQRVFEHRREIALQEHAGRLAARILHDLHVVRRRRVARDPGALERQRIGHRGKRAAAPPAPHRADIDRMVGSDGVEVMAGRKTPVGQLVRSADVFVRRLAHRHEHDPFAGGRRLRRAFHHGDDVRHRVQAGNGDAAARLEAFAVRMRMRVEETRQHGPPAQVDQRGGWSGVLEQFRIVADRRDLSRLAPRWPARFGNARSSVMTRPPCRIRSGGSMHELLVHLRRRGNRTGAAFGV